MSLGDVIPNDEILWRFVKCEVLQGEDIPLAVFGSPTEFSVDWALHRRDPRTSFHYQENGYGIVAIKVCDDVRNPKNDSGVPNEAWAQKITHDPYTCDREENCVKEEISKHGENIAHSLIAGKKKFPVQKAMKVNSRIEEKGCVATHREIP